jgi:hypothetical protein
MAWRCWRGRTTRCSSRSPRAVAVAASRARPPWWRWLGDDRRAGHAWPGLQRRALEQARVAPGLGRRRHAHACAPWPAAWRTGRRRPAASPAAVPRPAPTASTDAASITSARPASGRRSAGGSASNRPPDGRRLAGLDGHRERRVGALVAQQHALHRADARGGTPWPAQFGHAASPAARRCAGGLTPGRRRPAAAPPTPRASRSGRPGPCRRPTARRPAGGSNTRLMPSASATRQACWPPAPPKHCSV